MYTKKLFIDKIFFNISQRSPIHKLIRYIALVLFLFTNNIGAYKIQKIIDFIDYSTEII